uniref:Transmembrane protein n=1 Tax=Panulirus argus virus 1 TaxID=380624 RepID=A0A6G9HDM6_9VIRU|nr:hypothetical protein [Panulirus argus virus 1]
MNSLNTALHEAESFVAAAVLASAVPSPIPAAPSRKAGPFLNALRLTCAVANAVGILFYVISKNRMAHRCIKMCEPSMPPSKELLKEMVDITSLGDAVYNDDDDDDDDAAFFAGEEQIYKEIAKQHNAKNKKKGKKKVRQIKQDARKIAKQLYLKYLDSVTTDDEDSEDELNIRDLLM